MYFSGKQLARRILRGNTTPLSDTGPDNQIIWDTATSSLDIKRENPTSEGQRIFSLEILQGIRILQVRTMFFSAIVPVFQIQPRTMYSWVLLPVRRMPQVSLTHFWVIGAEGQT